MVWLLAITIVTLREPLACQKSPRNAMPHAARFIASSFTRSSACHANTPRWSEKCYWNAQRSAASAIYHRVRGKRRVAVLVPTLFVAKGALLRQLFPTFPV